MSFCQRDVMVDGAPLSSATIACAELSSLTGSAAVEQLAGIDQERGAIGKPRRDDEGDVADAAAIDANTWESHAAYHSLKHGKLCRVFGRKMKYSLLSAPMVILCEPP